MESTPVVLRRVAVVLAVALGIVTTPLSGALAAPGPAPAAAGSSPAAVAPEVVAEVAKGEVRVVAVTDAPGEQVVDDVVSELPPGSASGVEAGGGNSVALTVDAEGLAALAAAPAVEQIVEDKPNVPSADQWLTTVGAPAAQAAGWDGTGRTVAILDTGVQADHPYLAGKVVAEACFSSNSPGSLESLCPGGVTTSTDAGSAAPCVGIAGCEHGTHVAGIAAGGPVTIPSALVGVAPSTSIIAVKVFTKATDDALCGALVSSCIVAYDSDIEAALNWLIEQRQAGNPVVAGLDAVNLSLGGGLYAGACDVINPAITAAVNTLRNLGVATVAATGNNGRNGQSGTVARMASPACISTVVSVGATTGAGALGVYSNLTSATTILAPGSTITSSKPGSTYGPLTGTSMAAPVISGAFTALRERYPAMSVADAVALLRSTGDRIDTAVGVMPELQLDQALADVPGRPTRAPGSPFGAVDVIAGSVGVVSFAGWAIDPDTASSIPVHVYVDGVGSALTADSARPDVHAAFGYGPSHGYSGTRSVSPGAHTVCVYGINVGVGGNVLLGCRTVTVPGGSPIGSLDVATSSTPGTIRVAGWAIDPDTASSIPVHVYVDGTGYALSAAGYRSDLAAVFGVYGGAHAFDAVLPATPGAHTVCAYGINVGVGANSLIACRTVVVAGGSPFGSLDLARRNPDGTLTVAGWAIDPDTASPIAVHVYVVGAGYPLTGFPLTADGSRPDVGSVYPAYGSPHGFSAVVGSGIPPGATMCAYGINVGVGANSVLGCRVLS